VANPHRARRLALQGLCCIDVQGEGALAAVDVFFADAKDDRDTITLARKTLTTVLEDRDSCDELLEKHSGRWRLSRLALVDRNILRLSVHELRDCKLPPKVAISEAVKLANEFSSAESPRFVNGILDAVAREISAALGREETDLNPPTHTES
jgi:N utilization substance protein B